MPYRFETGNPVQDNFRTVAVEQLDRAVTELTEGVAADPVEAVHNARKALKMERSLLRLARESLPGKARRRENARLRDAAGRLSSARDADVMIEALDGLAHRYAGQLPGHTFGAIRARLEGERANLRTGLGVAGVIEAVTDELRSSRVEVAGWSVRGRGFAAVAGGLERSYARGRTAMERADRRPTDENLHEWRKRVKDLWYHLRLLEPTAPLTLAGQVGEAHALADLLGDDHDLAVLRATVRAMGPDLAVDHTAVLGLLDHRRRQLQEEAHFLGARLYAEKPGGFVSRLGRYWKAAEQEARALHARNAAEAASAVGHAHPA